MIIHIQQQWLDLAKKGMLYPKVDELLLCDDDLKSLCIFPAMVDYFNKFPRKVYDQTDAPQNELVIDFPDEETLGVLDARIVEKNYAQRTTRSSDFFALVLHQRSSSGLKSVPRYNKYSKMRKRTNFNPEGLRYQYINERQMMNSLNEMETFKYVVDQENKKLIIYSSIPSKVAITWGKMSYDFDKVLWAHKNNVCKLASAYYFELAADWGSIMEDSNQEKQFNVSELRTRAEKIREDIMETWKAYPNMFVMRGA